MMIQSPATIEIAVPIRKLSGLSCDTYITLGFCREKEKSNESQVSNNDEKRKFYCKKKKKDNETKDKKENKTKRKRKKKWTTAGSEAESIVS